MYTILLGSAYFFFCCRLHLFLRCHHAQTVQYSSVHYSWGMHLPFLAVVFISHVVSCTVQYSCGLHISFLMVVFVCRWGGICILYRPYSTVQYTYSLHLYFLMVVFVSLWGDICTDRTVKYSTVQSLYLVDVISVQTVQYSTVCISLSLWSSLYLVDVISVQTVQYC